MTKKTAYCPPSDKGMPREISCLEEHWRDLWASLPALASYNDLCKALHFRSAKSLSATLCSDPDAPEIIFVGRSAAIARKDAVLWAAGRAARAGRRGRRAASTERPGQ